MYTSEALLNSNITPPVSTANRVSVRNYNTADLISVGEYLVVLLGSSNGSIEYESESGILVDFASETGTLSAATTGLNSTFNYYATRTGWILVHDGSKYKRLKVKEFNAGSISIDGSFVPNYDSNANNAVAVLEILEIGDDYTYDYDYTNHIIGWAGANVSATVDGDSRSTSDVTGVTIDDSTNLVVSAFLVVTASDISNSAGRIELEVVIKDGVGGSILDSSTDATESATTLNISNLTVALSSASGSFLEVEVNIDETFPI